MRTRILTAFCTVLSLAPLASLHAQEVEAEETQEGQEGQQEETGGLDVVETPPQPTPQGAPAQGRASAPGQVHTVETGDTLWDLSQRYLGSPWYWPKVWSYNPEIANPHWIYPGNSVRFYGAGEEVPSRVEVGPVAARTEDIEAPTALDELPEDLVTVAGKIGYQGAPTYPVSTEAFLSRREVEEAGVIESSPSGSNMLSWPDKVYVRFKRPSDARVGDRYSIFRTTQKVDHPVTGKSMGYLTQVLGQLVVTDVGNKLVTAEIQGTQDEVSRGDLVGPAGEQQAAIIRPRPNRTEVKGYVVSATVPSVTLMGEFHRIFLDQGSGAGVEVGNSFVVLRRQDGLKQFLEPARDQPKDLPEEDIAACLVVEVREQTSTCLLTRSLREVVAGDRVEMRVGQEPSARL